MRRNIKWGVVELRCGCRLFSPQMIFYVHDHGRKEPWVLQRLRLWLFTPLSRAKWSLEGSGFDISECGNEIVLNTCTHLSLKYAHKGWVSRLTHCSFITCWCSLRPAGRFCFIQHIQHCSLLWYLRYFSLILFQHIIKSSLLKVVFRAFTVNTHDFIVLVSQ